MVFSNFFQTIDTYIIQIHYQNISYQFQVQKPIQYHKKIAFIDKLIPHEALLPKGVISVQSNWHILILHFLEILGEAGPPGARTPVAHPLQTIIAIYDTAAQKIFLHAINSDKCRNAWA